MFKNFEAVLSITVFEQYLRGVDLNESSAPNIFFKTT